MPVEMCSWAASSAAPQPVVIRSSLLGATGPTGPSGGLEPMRLKMPMKIPMRVPTKPHSGHRGAQLLESSDEDQPTTAGGTTTPDSCRMSANGLSTPPDMGEPFPAGGGKAAYLAPAAAPALLPPGLGQSLYSLTPFDADPAEGRGCAIDHALVMQGMDARYTGQSLLEELYHSGFVYGRDIQLFYLPCDATGANFGRCFLSFDAVSTRNQFIAAWQGKRMLLARGTDEVSFAAATTKDVLGLFADCTDAISEEPPLAPAAGTVSEQATNFCTRCGARVNAGKRDKFCAACGAPVRDL